MAILEIVELPNKRLSTKCKPVEVFDNELKKIASDMSETMYAAPGIGLAAPQVGLLIRFFVCDVSPEDEEQQLLNIVNPQIIETSGETSFEEGCLSVPGVFETVKRAESIELDYQDLDGNKQHLSATGMLAICIQHEADHLNGTVFLDHLSSLKRKLSIKRMERFKIERQKEEARANEEQ